MNNDIHPSQDIKEKISTVGEDARKIANQAKSKLSELASDTKDSLLNMEECIEDYAKEKPWRLIAWSVLAGAIVSKLFQK